MDDCKHILIVIMKDGNKHIKGKKKEKKEKKENSIKPANNGEMAGELLQWP